MPMSRKIKQEAIVFLETIIVNEFIESGSEFFLGWIEDLNHMEIMFFQSLADRFDVIGYTFQIRPTCRVVTHPNDQGVTLLIEANRFSGFSLDFDPFDAPLRSKSCTPAEH